MGTWSPPPFLFVSLTGPCSFAWMVGPVGGVQCPGPPVNFSTMASSFGGKVLRGRDGGVNLFPFRAGSPHMARYDTPRPQLTVLYFAT